MCGGRYPFSAVPFSYLLWLEASPCLVLMGGGVVTCPPSWDHLCGCCQVCIHTCIHVCIGVCVPVRVCACMHVCVCVCSYLCYFVCVVNVFVCLRVSIRIEMHTRCIFIYNIQHLTFILLSTCVQTYIHMNSSVYHFVHMYI